MAERDSAAVRVDVRAIHRQLQLAQHGDRLAGESLVELDHVEVGWLEFQPRAEFPRGRYWADTHDTRRNAGARAAEDPRDRGEPVALRSRLRGDDQRRSTVVHPGGVPGRDRATFTKGRRQLRQGVQGGVGARMLVPVHYDRIALPL